MIWSDEPVLRLLVPSKRGCEESPVLGLNLYSLVGCHPESNVNGSTQDLASSKSEFLLNF